MPQFYSKYIEKILAAIINLFKWSLTLVIKYFLIISYQYTLFYFIGLAQKVYLVKLIDIVNQTCVLTYVLVDISKDNERIY